MNFMIFISRAIAFIIKLIIPIITILYISFAYLYIKIENLPKSQRILFINNVLNKIVKNRSFVINDAKISHNSIYLDIKNIDFTLQNQDSSIINISIPDIKIFLVPNDILKFRLPLYFNEIPLVSINFDNINYHITKQSALENDTKYLEVVDALRNKIRMMPIFLKRMIKSGLVINKFELKYQMKNKQYDLIVLRNLNIKSSKLKRNGHREIIMQYDANSGNTILKGGLTCDANVFWQLNSCKIKINISDLDKIQHYIQDYSNISKNLELSAILKKFDISLDINLKNNTEIKNFTISGINGNFGFQKNKIKFDKFTIAGKISNNTLNINDIDITSGKTSITSDKSTKLNLSLNDNGSINILSDLVIKANNVTGKDDILKSLILISKDLYEFLASSIINGSDIKTQINVTAEKWGVAIDIKNGKFHIEKILPEITGSDINIIIDENNTKVSVKSGFFQDKITTFNNAIIDINYTKDIIINIIAGKILGKVSNIFNNLSKINTEIKDVLDPLGIILHGKRCKSENCTDIVCNNCSFKMNLDSDDVYKNIMIIANGETKLDDIHFFEKNESKSTFLVQKNIGENELKISIGTTNPIHTYFIYQNEAHKNEIKMTIIPMQNRVKLFADIVVDGKNYANSTVDISDDIEAIFRIGDDNVKGIFKLLNNSNIIADITINDYDLNNLNKHDIDFSGIKSKNSLNISNIDLKYHINNVIMPNNTIIDQFIFRNKIENRKLNDIYLSLASKNQKGEETSARIVKSEKNKYDIKINSLVGVLSIFNLDDKLSINDISGHIETIDDTNITNINFITGKVIIKIPSANNNQMQLTKIFIPSYSMNSNALEYNKINWESKLYWYNNTLILNITDFYVKSDISKITGGGFIDLNDKYINLTGKINTAHTLNRILTAEDVPLLNKILTFNSKDGGIGAIKYILKDKISNLSVDSIKLSGDKSNLIAAGGLALINPLFAIPFVIMSKDNGGDGDGVVN